LANKRFFDFGHFGVFDAKGNLPDASQILSLEIMGKLLKNLT
jgi:hypothetical protein